MSKKHTRDAALALMASGVALSEEEIETPAETPADSPAEEPKVEAEIPVEESKAEVKPADTDTLLSLTKQVARLELQLEQAQAELSTSVEASASAKKVIQTATERLAIAMGSTVVGLESLSLAGLCTQFNSLNTKFEERFSSGPVAQARAPESDVLEANQATRRRIEASKRK